MQEDIKSLGKQIDSLNVDAANLANEEFRALHGDVLQRLSTCANLGFQPRKGHFAYADPNDSTLAFDYIVNNFYIPQVTERQQQIAEAYRKTYRWVLEPRPGGTLPWDSFISWLRDPFSESRIYWVHRKIGAGRTVLLRFSAENLDIRMHMLPWAEEAAVLKASYFFWSAGNELQKSCHRISLDITFNDLRADARGLAKSRSAQKVANSRLGRQAQHGVDGTGTPYLPQALCFSRWEG